MPGITPNIPLSAQLADELRRRIAEGEYAVGALLPTEAELAAEFEVSRNSLREAIRSLVHAGLLGARAGYGTFVVAASDVAPALARRLDHDRAEDVAEVRLLLEREGARLAALRAGEPERRAILDALAARAAAETAPEYAAADVRFHRAVQDASGNALLAELYRGVGGNEQALAPLAGPEVDLGAQRAAFGHVDDAHAELAAAIVAGDPAAAAAAAERMVRLAHEQTGFPGAVAGTAASDAEAAR